MSVQEQEKSRVRRFFARLNTCLAIPALAGNVLPTAASRLSARRLTALAVVSMGGVGILASVMSSVANGFFGANFDALMIASIGFGLGALTIIALATTAKMKLDDQAYVAVVAAWSGASVAVVDQHPLLVAFLLVSLAVVHGVVAGIATEPSATASDEPDSQPASLPTAMDLPEHDPITIDRNGAVASDIAVDGTNIGAGEPLVERIHLNDRIGFLQSLADVREGTKQTASCRVRFNENGPTVHPAFALKTLTLKKSSDGMVAASFGPMAGTVKPEPGPDEKARQTLAMVSHELRTPLNAIIGFSDVLKTGIFGQMADPRQAEYLELINNAGKDLLQLVNVLLDVSKLEAGAYKIHVEPFNLNRVTNDCARLLSGQAEAKNIHLIARLPDNMGEAVADSQAVRQIVVNLLSNAVKFTPEGGCVTVEAVKLERDAGFRIVVTDTGIGMTPDQVATACEAFKQVDNSYTRSCEGTGLGLALAKGLVELHGGLLTIESDPDIGTAVTATFPAVGRPADIARLDMAVTEEHRPVYCTRDANKGKAA